VLIEVPAHTLGLDIGDRVCVYRDVLGDGRRGKRGEVPTERTALGAFFQNLEPSRVVMEACTQSHWISRLAKTSGHEVLVANPRKLESLSKSDKKTDENDAEFLARKGRVDVEALHAIQHCSPEVQVDRELIQARALLVRNRVSVVNHVRSVVKVHGYRLKSCSTECFVKKGWPQIPEELRPALESMFEVLRMVSGQIDELEKKIAALTKSRYPVARMLSDRFPGIGVLTATSFVLRLEDPKRFSSSRQVGAYLGLVPRKQQSGEYDPQLHITKAGDKELRRLLVLAANYILGRFCKDCDLRRFGERVARGGGKNDRKRAKVAVARKLAVLMHLMWKRGEVYDPQYQTKLSGELQAS